TAVQDTSEHPLTAMFGSSFSTAATSLLSITVTPANPTIGLGKTVQLTATGSFDDGTVSDLSSVAVWTVGATARGSVTSSGLATSLATGPNTVTATVGVAAGSTTVSGAGPTHARKQDMTATRLLDGRVLIVGGLDGTSPTATTELFDPATGRFTAA